MAKAKAKKSKKRKTEAVEKRRDKSPKGKSRRGILLQAVWQKQWIVLLILFAVAFSVRFLLLTQIKDSPLYSPVVPGTDQYNFYQMGMRVARGEAVGQSPFSTPPLYIYYLGAIFKIFGINLFLVRIVQILIGSISCLLIYVIAYWVFGKTSAVIAGLIAGFYGVFLFYEVSFLGSFLVIFFSLLTLFFAILAIQKTKAWLLLLSGLFLGFSALARPNMLVVSLGIILWLFSEQKALALKGISLFLIGVILAIVPVTVRNYRLSGDIVLITSHGGINFYLGNNPKATATLWVPQESGGTQQGALDYAEKMAEKNMGRNLSISEISNYWYKEGLKYIIHQPFGYLKLLAKKIFYFWNAFEIPLDNNFYFAREYTSLLKLPWVSFFLVSPLALLGMALALRGKNTAAMRLLLFFVFFYFISVILFYVTSRYRLPIVPAAIIFASFSVVTILAEFKSKNFRLLLSYLGILVALFIFTRPAWLKAGGNFNYAVSYYKLGNYYLDRGELYLAAEEYKKALEIDASLVECRMNLGTVYNRLGKLEAAESEYRRALSYAPQNPYLHNNLANVLSKQDETTAAIAEYKQALTIDSSYAEAHNNLGALYLKEGRINEAIQELRRALAFNEKSPESYRNLGSAYSRLGRADSAIVAYSKALELEPNSCQTLNQIGVAYLLRGLKGKKRQDLEQAREFLRQSLALDSQQKRVKSVVARINTILNKMK